MTAGNDAYRQLQEHLDRMPVGYPATKSGVEIDLLKAIFSPKEASIATHLDHKHRTVDQIFETARGEASSRDELMRILDEIVSNEESVKAGHNVATYDELRRLIEGAGDHIAIQECFCRKAADMQGKHCQATDRREVCMSLGDLADLYIEEGWGRRISQQEALEISRKNEEEGLVLMPGNEQEAAFMCACCSECCGMPSMMKNFPKPADVVGSNYYAQVNAALCTGCGTCVERCPTGAVKVENTVSSVDLDRCIGCGL